MMTYCHMDSCEQTSFEIQSKALCIQKYIFKTLVILLRRQFAITKMNAVNYKILGIWIIINDLLTYGNVTNFAELLTHQ